jgi:hypothetical protein
LQIERQRSGRVDAVRDRRFLESAHHAAYTALDRVMFADLTLANDDGDNGGDGDGNDAENDGGVNSADLALTDVDGDGAGNGSGNEDSEEV